MAEFCSNCDALHSDYDLFRLALFLPKGRSRNLLCEGCNLRAIYKDNEGNIFLAKMLNNEIKFEPVILKDLRWWRQN